MSDPVLQREVVVPGQRSSGAAVVVVAFTALFVALGSSAFVLRVRMHGECPAARAAAAPVAAQAAAPASDDGTTADGRQIVPVTLVSEQEALAAAERALSDADRQLVATFRLAAQKDAEAALDQYNQLPVAGAVRHVLDPERRGVADAWMGTQLERMETELERQDCAAVDERLQRMQRLLPDCRLPVAMAGCPR